MDNNNGILAWDAVLDTDGEAQYIELEEGDYTFTVLDVEKGQFPGGQKLPPCPKATVKVEIDSDAGQAYGRFDLLLHTTLKFKLSDFFRCIGMKKHGEPLKMAWEDVPGKRGRAHFKPRAYTTRNGEIRHANEVDRFYDYDEQFMTTVPVAGKSPFEDVEV